MRLIKSVTNLYIISIFGTKIAQGLELRALLYYWAAVFSGGAGGARAPPEFGGFRKGAKPDFCLSEFSYYYEHPRI